MPIIPATRNAAAIPTIVGFNPKTNEFVVGQEARRLGLHSKGRVFSNFKIELGRATDAEFADERIAKARGTRWIQRNGSKDFEYLTTKDVVKIYFSKLLAQTPEAGDQVLIGIPASNDEKWKSQYRKRIREVFAELHLAEPQFLPEPFAVFQYFRHLENSIKTGPGASNVLVIDFGGGTVDSCIIQTTREGDLGRGGATAVPLGVRSVEAGGFFLDKLLLQRVVEKCRKQGIVWKDDPQARAQQSGTPLLIVENAKIALSKQLAKRGAPKDIGQAVEMVVFDAGSMHQQEVRCEINGADLKDAVAKLWKTKIGPSLISTVARAATKHQVLPIEQIDLVLLSGGSSSLPFLPDLIEQTFAGKIRTQQIVVGKHSERAVALGLACEYSLRQNKGQTRTDSLAPFFSSGNLFLFLSKRRQDRPQLPVEMVRVCNGKRDACEGGALLDDPFEADSLTLLFEGKSPVDLAGPLLFSFTGENDPEQASNNRLNLQDYSFTLPNQMDRKFRLNIEVSADGYIQPTFIFYKKGRVGDGNGIPKKAKAFCVDTLQVLERTHSCTGIDFGTTNSYIGDVRSEIHQAESPAWDIPNYYINEDVARKLRQMEMRLPKRDKEPLTQEARRRAVDFIFHSNKLEQIEIERGETARVVEHHTTIAENPRLQPARNLHRAYEFGLDGLGEALSRPLMFIREINRLVLGVTDGGNFREEDVEIAGMSHKPPPHAAVQSLMTDLADWLRKPGDGLSSIFVAAALHTRFTAIHPFVDGNGRTARILLNCALMTGGFPAITIRHDQRNRYLDALESSARGDLSDFVALVAELVEASDEELAEVMKESDTIQSHPPEEVSGGSSMFQEGMVVMAKESEASSAEESMNQRLTQAVGSSELEELLGSELISLLRDSDEALKSASLHDHNACTASFSSFREEAKIIVEAADLLNAARLKLEYTLYDDISEEQYARLCTGRTIPDPTWSFGILVRTPSLLQKFVFIYDQSTLSDGREICLRLGTLVNGVYVPMQDEPVALREVVYRGGTIEYITSDDVIHEGSPRPILRQLLSEIIRWSVGIGRNGRT